jgi:hypothetical protein
LGGGALSCKSSRGSLLHLAGWLAHTLSFLRSKLDDTGHSPPRKSQKVV